MRNYVSNLANGAIAFYDGKAFKVRRTEERIILTRESEEYQFAHNSMVLVECFTDQEAKERAAMYLTGLSTTQNQRRPSKTEVLKLVELHWHEFTGDFNEVLKKFTR